ncbi:MAG: BamA/OMP85 family outer membrane protein [Planctomycetota bacterium]
MTDALRIREGGPFYQEGVEYARKQWNESGLFGSLSLRVEPAVPGQVELILGVVESVSVTSVSFRGSKRFSDRRLGDFVEVEPGDVVTNADARRCERRIAAAYREDGFAEVTVRASLSGKGPAERELLFTIDEGGRVYVTGIRFEGNEQVDSDELRRVMQSKKRRWLSWLWPGWFDEEVFREDVLSVEAACHDRGFLDARAEGRASYAEDMESVVLVVRVSEGDLYRVVDVTFEGNTLFRDDELLAALPLAPGDPYGPRALTEAADAISALYAGQAHWDVTIEKGNLVAEELYSAAGTEVSLRFRITEGEPVFIRQIHIRGLTKTREPVVRRNLTFYPGERASADEFKESERVLLNTGYFDRTAPKPVEIALAPEPGPLRDAIVQVEEGPTGRLMVGAGVGSESGVIGSISIVEDNFDFWNWPDSWADFWHGNAFRGGGHRLTILLSAGTERSYYSIAFENPAVRNTEYSFGTNLYSRGTTRREWDETRTGLSVTGGEHTSRFAHRSVTIGYESVDLDEISTGAPPVITKEKGSHSKPFVRLAASVDRRDNRYVPADGHYIGGTVEVAAGDAETVKLELRGEKYWTVREERGQHKHVVAVRGQVGLVDSFGGSVPVYERFYAGGFSTLRGFDFEGVSPMIGGYAVGGESRALGSVEYSFPITKDDSFRLVTFCDAGTVHPDVEDVVDIFDELRLSVGVGIRIQVPFLGALPVELDVAAPIMKESGDETQNIHFSIAAQRTF